MAPTSILHDPYYLNALSWSDVEALMMRSHQVVPRCFVSKRGLMNLSSMPDSVFRRQFRFAKDDFPTLCQALGIPKTVSSAQGVNIPGWEALCILLRRLAYPNRLCDLELFFGRHSSVISSVTNILLERIDRSFGHLLDDVSQLKWLSATDLDELSEAVYNKGAPLRNCWAFIDGTARPICRPSQNQQEYFSGHKRLHALKYQALMCANGLICELDGPYPGKRHDAGILFESDLYSKLERLVGEHHYVIYGDPAYPLRHLIMKPYGGSHLTQEQQNFNSAMSTVRQAVEWGFGKVVSEFAFLDFKKNQKLLLQAVAENVPSGSYFN